MPQLIHVFSCENDPDKQRWILTALPELRCLFDDIRFIGGAKATNVVTGRLEAVLTCRIFIAGFSCVSVSTQSNKSAGNQDGIDAENCATGITVVQRDTCA